MKNLICFLVALICVTGTSEAQIVGIGSNSGYGTGEFYAGLAGGEIYLHSYQQEPNWKLVDVAAGGLDGLAGEADDGTFIAWKSTTLYYGDAYGICATHTMPDYGPIIDVQITTINASQTSGRFQIVILFDNQTLVLCRYDDCQEIGNFCNDPIISPEASVAISSSTWGHLKSRYPEEEGQ